jgi:hypothetical protein
VLEDGDADGVLVVAGGFAAMEVAVLVVFLVVTLLGMDVLLFLDVLLLLVVGVLMVEGVLVVVVVVVLLVVATVEVLTLVVVTRGGTMEGDLTGVVWLGLVGVLATDGFETDRMKGEVGGRKGDWAVTAEVAD